MTPDDPRHGKYAGAIQHWKDGEQTCEPCAAAQRRMDKSARLDRHRGRPRMVTLGDTAWNILHTVAHNQLVTTTGLRADKLARYHKAGPDTKVHRTTRDKILAARGHDYWTPIGIQRRVQALNALGWSMAEVSRRSGVSLDAVRRLGCREKPTFVRREVAARLVAVYDELCMTPPPAGRVASTARKLAARQGRVPPLAWDDIDRDAAPVGVGAERERRRYRDLDEAVIERLLSGERIHCTQAEREVVVARWVAAGGSQRDICRRHGWREGRYKTREAAA